VSARDEICNLMAAYCQALDDGRNDDVVATFADGASFEIVGMDKHVGADELRAVYDEFTPKVPQRHVVSSTHITSLTDTRATATSDFTFLVNGGKGWAVAAVGRYDDELVCADGEWRFASRAVSFR
jgi:uncharacterized protein (TIGR02246 family)